MKSLLFKSGKIKKNVNNSICHFLRKITFPSLFGWPSTIKYASRCTFCLIGTKYKKLSLIGDVLDMEVSLTLDSQRRLLWRLAVFIFHTYVTGMNGGRL